MTANHEAAMTMTLLKDIPHNEEPRMPWNQTSFIPSQAYTCGYCSNRVASALGYQSDSRPPLYVYVCPHCDQPTYMVAGRQYPPVLPGQDVPHVPDTIAALYHEARAAVGAQASTGAVLLARKLLMHIAVVQGAREGESFLSYVEYLATAGYVPPQGRGWVDHIRRKGNEATHEIVLMSQADAIDLLTFLEMLLKFIYEFPAKLPAPPAP